MKEFEETPKNVRKNGPMDHPEQYETEEDSLFDRFVSQRTVDPIPMEDLKLAQQDEKNKEKTKSSSSSEKKYKP